MSTSKPRYYKYYPQEVIDLGTMPFEGDWTLSDRIQQKDVSGIVRIYMSNGSGTEFGRMVYESVNGRMKQVWKPGVEIFPIELSGVNYPVWFEYYGDGICAVKLPNGDQPEPYVESET